MSSAIILWTKWGERPPQDKVTELDSKDHTILKQTEPEGRNERLLFSRYISGDTSDQTPGKTNQAEAEAPNRAGLASRFALRACRRTGPTGAKEDLSDAA